MSARNKQSDIYNNWQMHSPTGQLLARCSQKRAEWYLTRNLASQIDEKSIKLAFEPGGGGNSNVPFLLEEKQNICVVCGADDNLNRHHVVPYQYRKWMPPEDKGHSSYDVLPICIDHHDQYEEQAQIHSREIALEYDAPFSVGRLSPEDGKAMKMYGLLKVIAEGRKIPSIRLAEIQLQLDEFFRVHVTTPIAIKLLEAGVPVSYSHKGKSHGQAVIEKVMETNQLQNFIVKWRQHFLDTMNPQFLSDNWSVFHVHRG